MNHRYFFRLVKTAVIIFASVIFLISTARAQFVCDGAFYQVKQASGDTVSTLFRINRDTTPYSVSALYPLPALLNALAYNPVDNYQYAVNVNFAPSVLYRLGPAGVVPIGTAGPGGTGVAIKNMPSPGLSGWNGAGIDRQGNYIITSSGSGGSGIAETWPIVVVTGLSGSAPTPAAVPVTNIQADPNPPAGYTGTTTYAWGDLAVSPTESSATVTVLYGVTSTNNDGNKIYRLAINNSGTANQVAYVSYLTATNYPTGAAFGANFFDASGSLYLYSNAATASQGFYFVNTTTGLVTNVSGAAAAAVSDGSSCAFSPMHLDVVKKAEAVSVVNATTFDVPYTLKVANTDSTTTDLNVQVSDNLKLTFSAGSPALSIVSPVSVTEGGCTPNTSFDGATNLRLLTGTDALSPSQSCTIKFTVRVSYPNVPSIPATKQLNSAYASSTSNGPNAGYTFLNGQPVPPPALLAADTSTDGSTVPLSPNADQPTPTPVEFQPRIQTLKSVSPTGAVAPGQIVTYTVVVSNTSTIASSGATITDPLPAGIDSATWTCSASGGAVCPNASGNNGLNETISIFPAGSALTYTIQAKVGSNPPATITNTASATPPPGGLCAPADTAPPCSSSVTNTSVPIVDVSKVSTSSSAIPGGQVVWSLVIRNTGSASADGTIVKDPVPTGLDSMSWQCQAASGGVCPAPTSGSGAIDQIIQTLPAGATLTYTVTGTVSANPPTSIQNTALITPPGGGVCQNGSASPCSATSDVPSAPRISVQKTANTTAALTPGGSVTYTVVVANTGSVPAPNTTVTDSIPAGISKATWVCASSAGAACPNTSGSGNLNETITVFPPGATLTYTISATVGSNPLSTITNTVSASTPNGVCAPNNTAIPCTTSVSNSSAPIVSLTKSADTATISAGGSVTYTITAKNLGTVDAAGTVISDILPSSLSQATWSCIGENGAVCETVQGTGSFSIKLTAFPVGSNAVITVKAKISQNPSETVENVAKATPPVGGICMTNSSISPCESKAKITTKNASIPTLNLWALLCLVILFGVYGAKQTSCGLLMKRKNKAL